MSEWKPGDVATGVVTTRGHERRNLVRTDRDAYPWRVEDEIGGHVAGSVVKDVEARPLVVIDPEDREQVERLVDLIDGVFNDTRIDGTGPNSVQLAQAALRSLLAPPRPDEPTGKWAVVEDVGGEQWIRATDDNGSPWLRDGYLTAGDWTDYADIAVVRVLSEGVQP